MEVSTENSGQHARLSSATSINPSTLDDTSAKNEDDTTVHPGVHTISDKIPCVPVPILERKMSDSHPTPGRKIHGLPVIKENSSDLHEKRIHGVPVLPHKLPVRPVIPSTSRDFPAFPVTPTGVSVIPTASSAQQAIVAKTTCTSAREMHIDACFVTAEIPPKTCTVSTPTDASSAKSIFPVSAAGFPVTPKSCKAKAEDRSKQKDLLDVTCINTGTYGKLVKSSGNAIKIFDQDDKHKDP